MTEKRPSRPERNEGKTTCQCGRTVRVHAGWAKCQSCGGRIRVHGYDWRTW